MESFCHNKGGLKLQEERALLVEQLIEILNVI